MRTPRHIEALEYGPGKSLKTSDPGLTRIFQEVRTIYAPADFPVVIHGETGTGKEGVARALHWHSPRRNKPFVAVNCGAIPEGIVDSEFFGHERGAFSGAITTRKGHFEIANGGTLFLDEIGEMPLTLQARLLRVLQEGEVTRVGSSKPISIDIRVMAATNRNLQTLVEEGKFRLDLFHRLAAAFIHIPPLRERPADISVLARLTLAQIPSRDGALLKLHPLTVYILRRRDWPGNVRELQSTIQVAGARAVAEGRMSLEPKDVQFTTGSSKKRNASESEPETAILADRLSRYLSDHPNTTIMSAAAVLGMDYHRCRRMILKMRLRG